MAHSQVLEKAQIPSSSAFFSRPLLCHTLVGCFRHAFSQELTGLGGHQHQVPRLEVRVSRANAKKSHDWEPRETEGYQKSGTTWSSYVALYPQQAGGKESGRHQPWEWEGETPEGQTTSQSSASLLEGLRRCGGLFLAQGCEHSLVTMSFPQPPGVAADTQGAIGAHK